MSAASYSRSAKQVFEAWSGDYHAEGMERHHWPAVERALEHVPVSDGHYLEIGVGNGYGIRAVAGGPFAAGCCHGLDIAAGMIDRAREKTADLSNVELSCGDFLGWTPPVDVRFDCIFSMEVFYYFAEIQPAIDRAASLLAPGGMLMVLVNYYTEHEASHDWPGQLDTPMSLWSAADYRRGFDRRLEQVEQQRFGETLATWGRRA